MNRNLTVAALAGLAHTLVACPKAAPPDKDGKPAPSASAPAAVTSASASASASGTASAKAKAKVAPPSREKKPLTEDDKAKLKAYNAGLLAGRKATVDKDYAAAIKGFDEALTARPDDPRALSERGYAKLLARDYKGARADLDKSARGTSDKKLLASIWYNEGLISESLGEGASASLYFARSNALNPTKAAQAKLEGKSKCPAAVDKTEALGKAVKSWREGWDVMAAAYGKEWSDPVDEKAESDEAVKKLVCDGGDCKGQGPWVVAFGGPITGVRFLVASVPGDKLAFVPLGSFGYPMCGGEYKAEVTGQGLLHVRSSETIYIRGPMKETKDGMVPCDDKDPPEKCFSACASSEDTEVHQFVDLGKAALVLAVTTDTDAKHAPLVTVKESNGTVTVNGAGCNETAKLK